MNDLDLALQCQRQYNGQIPLRTVAEVDYSIVQNDDALDIVFQGTSNLEDAKRDLEALMFVTEWGRVHKGAYDGLSNVYLAEKDNLPKDKPIRISGHSLGSMEASMFACMIRYAGYQNVECITLACPLWGDRGAIAYFTNMVKNHTYQNYLDLFHHDFFTMIPVWLPDEPYVPPPNRTRFWSAPTLENEYRVKYNAPEGIQAHSLADCYIPYLKKVFS